MQSSPARPAGGPWRGPGLWLLLALAGTPWAQARPQDSSAPGHQPQTRPQTHAQVQAQIPPQSSIGLPAEIARSLALHRLQAADLSLYLREVGADQPRLEINSGLARSPASTIKLLTLVAALDRLGPNYRWQTRVYLGGPLKDGRLDGDLIVQGGGDPDLGTEDLWRLLRELRQRGIETVGGNLRIDNGAFAPPQEPRDAFDGEGQDPYNALPVAFAVNDQATRLDLLPEPGAKRLRAFLVPPLANVTLINQVRLVEAPCRAKDHRLNLKVDEAGRGATLTLSGTFASQCGEERLSRLILDPVTHSGAALAALWQEQGGRIEGQVTEGPAPQGAKPFHRLDSDELALAAREVGKWSNNPMARTLFLTLGMERFGRPATPRMGQEAIGAWLAERGLDFPELKVENGSGLSRTDRISARSLGLLLDWAYSSPAMPELLASLPILGVDGTLHRRLKGEPAVGHGHLKTGTLKGVTGLAGYLEDREGRRWILVIQIESPSLQGWRGKAVEDTILRWVYAGVPGVAPAPRVARSLEGPAATDRRFGHQ